jgi:hypothetical protein
MRLSALLLLAASLLIARTLAAQEPTESSRGPDGGTRIRVTGIEILPATGRPFSGRDNIEWARNLEDGTVVKTHLYATLARDIQGRIYRERRKFVPDDSSEESRQIEIILLDPVAHTRTNCMVATHRCTVTGYHGSATFTPMPVGPFDNGKRYLSREGLGSDVIDGLDVVGTRETISINPGVVGNSQPLVSTRQFWYSADLQVNLSVTRIDPREGTQVIHVVDLARAEPDPAMFRLPTGFVIEDVREPAPSAVKQ